MHEWSMLEGAWILFGRFAGRRDHIRPVCGNLLGEFAVPVAARRILVVFVRIL